MMSRMHVGSRAITSIVVKNDDGILTRLMLAHKHHFLDTKSIYLAFPLGIHSHLYDFTTSAMFGKIYYECWDRGKNKTDEFFYEYKFDGKTGDILPVSAHSPLALIDEIKLTGKETTYKANHFHSFKVIGQQAAWVINEHNRTQEEMTVFSWYPIPRNNLESRQFIGPEHVRRFVIDFFNEAENDGLI